MAWIDLGDVLGIPVVGGQSTIGPYGSARGLAVVDEVDRVLAAYERSAVVQALGGRHPDLTLLLTVKAAQSLNPAERGVLTDEATVVAASLRSEANSVVLAGFKGPDGTIDVVDATLTMKVAGTTVAGAPFTITRTGHLTFVNENGWRIDSFGLSVERDLP